MQAIKIAIVVLMLLATMCSAKADDQPTKAEIKKYTELIRSKLVLPDKELKSGFNESIRFYFTVNERGEVDQVSALTSDPILKQKLESKFKQIQLKDFPANILSQIRVHFIVY